MRASAWVGWTLCLCASSAAVSARDEREDDQTIPDLIHDDGTHRGAGAGPAAEFLRCNKAAWRVPSQFLVVLKEGTHESQVQRTIRRLRAQTSRRGHLVEILQIYSGALQGFLLRTSQDVLHLILEAHCVELLGDPSYVTAWGCSLLESTTGK